MSPYTSRPRYLAMNTLKMNMRRKLAILLPNTNVDPTSTFLPSETGIHGKWAGAIFPFPPAGSEECQHEGGEEDPVKGPVSSLR